MTDNRTTELLCKLLEERGIEWKDGDAAYDIEWSTPDGRHCSAMYWKPTLTVLISGCTPEQAIAATLGRPKAKSHPYGYERDTGAYDCTRCECGCINDISDTYCNDCGGEIEIDESAEKEYYDGCSKHTVLAKKHDDGSLEFCARRYVPEDAATLGGGKLTANDVRDLIERHSDAAGGNGRDFHNGAYEAIADELNAALGSDECEFRPFKDEDWSEPNAVRGVCSECSALMYGKDNYCPHCGKAVKR